MSPAALDIGHGVEVTPVIRDGVFIGVLWSHPAASSHTGRCGGGMVAFRGREADSGYAWELVSEEPLTLEPSLLCRACGTHGYIRGGRWEPAPPLAAQ